MPKEILKIMPDVSLKVLQEVKIDNDCNVQSKASNIVWRIARNNAQSNAQSNVWNNTWNFVQSNSWINA